MQIDGNTARVVSVMRRAAEGQPVTLGFLGGSITQGAAASAPSKTYVERTADWWRMHFPRSHIHVINAGVGATNSLFGVARVLSDLMCYAPDLCVIEFSVNDDGRDCEETYEGLIRRMLSADASPALLAVYNARYDDDSTAEATHRRIAQHYGIPGVSLSGTILRAQHAGLLCREDLSPDALHPNDMGHALLAGMITHALDDMLWQAGGEIPSTPLLIPAPLTKNGWQNVSLVRNDSPLAALDGFERDTRVRAGCSDVFSLGWTARVLGDAITFRLPCSALAVQYRRTITRPAAAARLFVDGQQVAVLDGAYDQDWGDCPYMQIIFEHEPLREREIRIQLHHVPDSAPLPFYLMSLIAVQ